MSTLSVDLAYLLGLKTDVDTTTTTLRQNMRDVAGTPSDTRIDGRIDSFHGDWDKRRGELAESLESVSLALQAIHDTFNETDIALTNALTGEGEGS